MFSGLVSAVGTVQSATDEHGGRTLTIAAPYTDLDDGESIAVDGACLTVERHADSTFQVHCVASTLDRTSFRHYAAGRRVNLERALRAGDRMGGHIVQGHVDGIGEVEAARASGDGGWLIDLKVPEAVARVSVPLGSITVDGVSLTVNALPAPGVIQVSIIPFTFEHTTLGERRPGQHVHVEADALGKYVEGLLARTKA